MAIINIGLTQKIGTFLEPLGLLIEGTSESETLYGGAGADTIRGYSGDDIIYGQAGNDELDGGAGNDILAGGLGADKLTGGAGVDSAVYTGAASGVNVSLVDGRGFTGEAQGDVLIGIENIYGSNFGDIIVGDQFANKLVGAAGEDWLFGKQGNDVLDGGDGDDVIKGGAGNDIIMGGQGRDILTGNGDGPTSGQDADVFVIGPIYGAPDTITDFHKGEDKIGIYGFNAPFSFFDGLAKGTDIEPGYNVHHAGQLFYDTDDHRLLEVVQMKVGGLFGGSTYTAKVLAYFTSDVNLSLSDFVYVNPDEILAARTSEGDGGLRGGLIDIPSNLADFAFMEVTRPGDTSSAPLDLSGNDIFNPGAGNDAIDGGAGFDEVHYAIARADASVVLNSDGSIQVAGGANVGTDRLVNVEKVAFSDGSLIFDVPASDDAALVYRIYQAAFARSPDEEGFRYWQEQQQEQHLDFSEIAAMFRTSAEFVTKYGANTSDDAYVSALYTNVLQRAPDGAGLQYWQDMLHSNAIDRDGLLVNFAQSAENVSHTEANIQDGYWVV